jgi:hypothetical protein
VPENREERSGEERRGMEGERDAQPQRMHSFAIVAENRQRQDVAPFNALHECDACSARLHSSAIGAHA